MAHADKGYLLWGPTYTKGDLLWAAWSRRVLRIQGKSHPQTCTQNLGRYPEAKTRSLCGLRQRVQIPGSHSIYRYMYMYMYMYMYPSIYIAQSEVVLPNFRKTLGVMMK